AQELVMVMNGFDTDGDGENNFYSVNGPAFYYEKHPIRVSRSQTVRISLANLTEFDLVNSFHLHGDFFRHQPTGTGDYWEYTDTIMLCQGERGIIEIDFANTGRFMFHAHQSEFAELGWMGFFEVVKSGEEFTYEFPAKPAGLHLYHCHTTPLKKHIHKGLYGAFIVDPREPRPPAQELVMVMNGFDTDADGENNFYTVNGRSFYYARYPIRVRRSETVRIYLANLTEFDPVNSFHLHGDFFRHQPTGTGDHWEYTDTVMQCQGQRGVLEIDFANTGHFMFHAHQSEFAELGWMGFFEVVD
ncbi:MAG: multicopper oxidase domain-containing protein, partial [Gaiellaceae bacterium]